MKKPLKHALADAKRGRRPGAPVYEWERVAQDLVAAIESERPLASMAEEVREVNESLGWRGPDSPETTFGDQIALLHSEASEAFEAWRDWGMRDATELRPQDHGRWCKARGYTGPCPSEHCPPPKPQGVGSEFADVLIRLLDMADRCGIDLDAEYERKVAYNRTRAFRHGGKAL